MMSDEGKRMMMANQSSRRGFKRKHLKDLNSKMQLIWSYYYLVTRIIQGVDKIR
jgi:hypothetical protein